MARWFAFHKPSATTSKPRRNPASGEPKSPAGHRCVPSDDAPHRPSGSALPADDFGPSYGSIAKGLWYYSNDRAGVYPQSWYAASAAMLSEFPQLDGDRKHDVCVISVVRWQTNNCRVRCTINTDWRSGVLIGTKHIVGRPLRSIPNLF